MSCQASVESTTRDVSECYSLLSVTRLPSCISDAQVLPSTSHVKDGNSVEESREAVRIKPPSLISHSPFCSCSRNKKDCADCASFSRRRARDPGKRSKCSPNSYTSCFWRNGAPALALLPPPVMDETQHPLSLLSLLTLSSRSRVFLSLTPVPSSKNSGFSTRYTPVTPHASYSSKTLP